MSNDLTQRLAKIWGALDPVDEWRVDISDAIDALTSQAAEIEALRADAERWRFFLTTRQPSTHETFRVSIDAAMLAGKAVTK